MMTNDYCSDSGSLVGSHGGAASLGLVLGQDLLVDVGSLLGLLEVGLDLAELGQVEGGDLLSLLDLLLVGLDLVLQLVDQLLHPLVVLLVLVLGEGQLLDTSLSPPLGLLSINQTSLLLIKLSLKILDLHLKPGDNLLPSLDGKLLSLVKLGLHVLDLVVEDPASSLGHLGILLLSPELISQPGSVNHRLLGLLLSNSALSQHFFEISLSIKRVRKCCQSKRYYGKDRLACQVAEGVSIKMRTGKILNSKTDWDAPSLITIERNIHKMHDF